MYWRDINWIIFSKKQQDDLQENIKQKYPIKHNASFYNPYLEFFTNSNLYKKRLNNKINLLLIKSQKEKVTRNINIKRVLLEMSSKRGKKKKYMSLACVKEIPLIPLRHIILLDLKKNILKIDLINYLIHSNLYSINNSAYIEIFVNFIISNLSENNLSPHFTKYYGSFTGIFKTFSYNTNIHPSNIFPEHINKKLIIKNTDVQGKYSVKIKNCPVAILSTEYIKETLVEYLASIPYNISKWKSVIFQIIAGLSIVQKKYNLTHNDLHCQNILCKKTKTKYLFYKFKEKIFRIPTFGRIIKIIDWGRSRLNLKTPNGDNLNIVNNCYNPNFELEGLYSTPLLKKSQKKKTPTNFSFDMTLFSHSLLHFFKDKILNDELYKFLNNICQLRKYNLYEKYMSNDINLYFDIAKYSKNGLPKDLIISKIFKVFLFKIDKPQTIIYNI